METGEKTFAQKSILQMVEKKKTSKSKFQDNDCRYDETYTQYDEGIYEESYGETYTVHDEGVGY